MSVVNTFLDNFMDGHVCVRFITTHLFHEFRSIVTNPEKLKKKNTFEFHVANCLSRKITAIRKRNCERLRAAPNKLIHIQYDTM